MLFRSDWQQTVTALDSSGIPWRSSAYNRMWDAQIRGELDEAAGILLSEIWNKPLAEYIARSSELENSMILELLSRPDVAKRKLERDEEFKLARAAVQEFLLSLEWNDS